MSQLLVDRKYFSNKYAYLANVQPIFEYSVTVDREVLNDRTHARYLVKENIRDNVDFDLKKGIDTYVDMCDDDAFKNEGRLHPLCNWACAQEGNDLKQLFDCAQFAGGSGTMQLIANTIGSSKFKKAWTVIAVKTNGVILLCEQTKTYDRSVNQPTLYHYSGYKFMQYMTTDKPDGETDTDAPVDNRPSFKMMMRSDIVWGDQSIGICYNRDVDALYGDTPIELKTRPIKNPLPFHQKVEAVLHSEFADTHTLVLGLKTEDLVVNQVHLHHVDDLKATVNKELAMHMAFLFNVLRNAKSMLATKDACKISFAPENDVVNFTEFPKKEAMDLLTPEFKKKFNLGD